MLENQIFISYSTKNSDIAIKLYNDLLGEGYPVWIDKATEEMKEWKPQIEDNLRHSNRYVVLISSHSITSKWVLHEGSMAYALKQMMIPLKIEEFGTFSGKELPLWVEEIQLVDFVDPLRDYENKLRKLKQYLGDPLPIQKHLEEMMIQYKTSGILLGEVALELIEKHKNMLVFPEGSKELIEKSKRALENYWTRYDNLEKEYNNARATINDLEEGYQKAKLDVNGLEKKLEDSNRSTLTLVSANWNGQKRGNGVKRGNLVLRTKFHNTITDMNHTIAVLNELLAGLPIGTNLAMLHVFWALLSGQLLSSRGALFPALKAIGLEDEAVRRAWTAISKGVWQTVILIKLWRRHVEGLPEWKQHEYEGYNPVVADVTAFWRPTLKNCPSKHYHPAAQRALPAVIFGIVGRVGEINGQRIALPQAFERVYPKDPSEARLWREILKNIDKTLCTGEIVVVDAGVKVRDLQEAGLKRYVVRLANNFTARRNVLPEYCGKGRKPEFGELIRPLARTYKDKMLPATAPDEIQSWVEDGRTLRAEIWRNLVLPDCVPDAHNQTFDVYAIHDPSFDTPWLLATPVVLKPISVRNMYKDRWPVEQIPLSAKQMIGSHRQFVHAEETIQRLPELALMAGSILSFLAATMPATPTGFWDRKPKRTPGRFRRTLAGRPFPEVANLSGRLRKKNSVTAHLPKGQLARMAKNVPVAPTTTRY